MKIPRRLALGGLVAAFVFSGYACATGGEPGEEGFGPDPDAGDEAISRDATVLPVRDGAAPEAGDDDAGPCDGKVVINELMTEGSVASDEFIELFNPGACAVSLAGWRLAYRSFSGSPGPYLHTFAAGAAIPAKSFLVLGTTKFAETGKTDAVMNGGMAKGDGQVALVDDTGMVVDGVAYGVVQAAPDGGTYREKGAAQSPTPGGSIARKQDGLDTDNNAGDFVKATPHTAGAPNQ